MTVRILEGHCLAVLRTLPAGSVHCCVTSPPYFGLRDYGVDGQIGLESTPADFIAALVAVFAEVRRVLRDDGTCWVNLGDSYNNFRSQMGPGQAVHGREKLNGKPSVGSRKRGWRDLKEKDLIGIPWRVAFALQADGWYLRQDIIWHKPNPMPESVRDRCTKAHEYLFLLSKSPRYYWNADAMQEPAACPAGSGNIKATKGAESPYMRTRVGLEKIGPQETRNRRSVWTVATEPFQDAHFATYPPALIEPCILAGCPPGGTVLDPFGGAGTTGLMADRLQRNAVLIELNPQYVEMARRRIHDDAPLLADVDAGLPA